MKALIEAPLRSNDSRTAPVFVEIINCIMAARTEADLRREMKLFPMRNYNFDKMFQYGFGSNHMWVSEARGTERLIFVEF